MYIMFVIFDITLLIYNIVIEIIIYIDELQVSLNNAEHKIKLMDSKLHESNVYGKKCSEQIDNLLLNEKDFKLQFENLKEENATLKLNSNRFEIKAKLCR